MKKVISTIIILLIIGCGGGGSSGGSSSSFTSSGSEPVLNTNMVEKSYTVEEGNLYVTQFQATDNSKVIYFIDGEDDKFFYINSGNGKLSFRNRPDFEKKKTYNLIVIARDIVGNETNNSVVINIKNIDEEDKDMSAPIFISDTTFTITKNSEIRILTSDSSDVTYSLKGNGRKDFNFNSSTGILIPIKLTMSTYNFTIEAKDSAGNISTQQIIINREEEPLLDTNLPEVDIDNMNPIFTSNKSITIPLSTQTNYSTAEFILEIETTDDSPVTYSLNGIDKNNLYLVNNFLYFSENAFPLTKTSYNVNVYAEDIYGNKSSQAIEVSINNDVQNITAPTFLSSNSNTVSYLNQTDYATAPSILDFKTDKPSYFSIEGTDASYVYISIPEENTDYGVVFFTFEAIPLTKDSYSFTLVATDEAGNESRQNITINISDYPNEGVAESTPSPIPTPTPNYENIEDIPPTFLSSNSNTVSYLNQTDYATAPSILDFKTDKPSYFSIEGTDASYVYISIPEENTDYGVIFFTEEAIPLTKDSYSFILVATDEYGNVSRQNITINISDYPNEGVGTPTPAPIDISGYWRDEAQIDYLHYNEDGTISQFSYDEENSCYIDISWIVEHYTINGNTISEQGFEGTFDITYTVERRDAMLIHTYQQGDSIYYYEIPPDVFYSITVCN